MTAFEKIRQSPEAMALFITELITEAEDKMLDKLDEYGIQTCIVRPAKDVRILDNFMLLTEEVDDDT